MRYRDEVFSDVTLTSDIPYGAGSAVDQDGHTDLLLGRAAAVEVFPVVTRWLTARSEAIAGTCDGK